MKGRSIGMILLGIYLIIFGALRFLGVAAGSVLLLKALAVLAIAAGVFLLLGK